MIHASVCTIGDEILIGQIIDTNSSHISTALGSLGIKVERMISIADEREAILESLRKELTDNEIVITTGGLGPTRDDITKASLAELSGSRGYVSHAGQLEVVKAFLHSRGLDVLDVNLQQAMVPDSCEVIVNRLGTAPVMVFRFPQERFGHEATLYALPGVPHEALGALPDVMDDIRAHFPIGSIEHRTIMTFGIAESALAKMIASWEDALPQGMHLAYLPNMLTGVRLRLSAYNIDENVVGKMLDEQIASLKSIIGEYVYADCDDTLEDAIGRLLRGSGKTISAAESCTGGEISHLLTTVPGSSEYYLGSVTSYAVSVKNNVLGVPLETISTYGIVSSQVAAAMAEGVRRLTGSTWSVATTGWADAYGDEFEPAGTVWIAVAGPNDTVTERRNYRNDRKRNIERFAASALDLLRRTITSDLQK